MSTTPTESCYLCGGVARLVSETRTVRFGSRRVVIDDRFYRCGSCGEQFYTGDMADETSRRISSAAGEDRATSEGLP